MQDAHARMIADPSAVNPIVTAEVGRFLLSTRGRCMRSALDASIEILEALSDTPAHPVAARCIVTLFFRAGYSFKQQGKKIVVRKLTR